MQRDAIDFGRMRIPQLFVRLFIPTLLGLLFTAIVTLADGIFVGRGVGSDALAAINIAAPLFQVAMGIALMFGSGVSIVAAIHLSQGNVKAARINVTQSLVAGTLLMLLVAAVSAGLTTLGGVLLCRPLIGCFLDSTTPAFGIAVQGFPLFSLSFVPFALNLVLIGYFQALEQPRAATSSGPPIQA